MAGTLATRQCLIPPWHDCEVWLCALSGSIRCSGVRTTSRYARAYRRLCPMCTIFCRCIMWRAATVWGSHSQYVVNVNIGGKPLTLTLRGRGERPTELGFVE